MVHAADAVSEQGFGAHVASDDGICGDGAGEVVGVGFVEGSGGVVEAPGVHKVSAGEGRVAGL